MIKRFVGLLMTSAAALSAPLAANAQTTGASSPAPTSPAPQSDPDSFSGDIVVTARKVSESVQKAPAAINVLPPESLTKVGVTDVRVVQFLVPSVRLNKQQSTVQMYIRGVGIATDAPSLDTGVAMNFNGVEQFREASGTGLFDVSRIEVLRGPQATTYGSNSAGGVINVLFNRPKNNYDGNIELEYGNWNRLRVTGAQNIPLGKDAEIRIAGDVLTRKGFAGNGLDDQKTVAGRVTLTARPSTNFDFMLWGSYYHGGGKGDVGYASPFKNPDNPWKQTWDPNAVVAFSPDQIGQYRRINLYELGGEFNLDLGGAQLTYIPGYSNINVRGRLIIDTGPARILFQDQIRREQITQELRLNNTEQSSRLQWLVGAYYYRLNTQAVRTVASNKTFNITRQPNEVIAGYAQLTYKVTDEFRVTGGLRYSTIDKSIVGTRFTPGNAATNPTPIPFSASPSWKHADWKAGVEYDVAKNSLLYASIQTGYLGGGINFFNSATQSNIVQPEKLLAYIAGMKNTLAGGRIKLNFEGFYYDWKNYQVGLLNVAAGTNVIFNAPKTEAYGFEVDSDFRITDDDHVNLGVGLFHGKFKNFVVPQGVSSVNRAYNFNGFDVPFAPRATVSLSYDHTFRLNGGSRVVFTAVGQYSSGFWTGFTHGITRCSAVPTAVLTQDQCVDPGQFQPRSVQANFDLTWRSSDDSWQVALWIRNATDQAIRTSGGDGGMTAAGVVTTLGASTLTPPRTFGFRVAKKW